MQMLKESGVVLKEKEMLEQTHFTNSLRISGNMWVLKIEVILMSWQNVFLSTF